MIHLAVMERPRREDFSSAREWSRAFETFHIAGSPTREQVLERAARFASESLNAVDLQIRRVRSIEPEDDLWLSRKITDCQFLIQALWGVRQAGKLAATVEEIAAQALRAFDDACPDLAVMRHVSQHMDEYVIDFRPRQRRPDDNRYVGRRSLENSAWSDDEFHWLGGRLHLDNSRNAAHSLYSDILRAESI
jgi:hypothetical protein